MKPSNHAVSNPDIKTLQRILVIRRDNIGDLICTLPFIHNLRRQYPQAQIDVLVNSYNQQTVEQQPDINHVYAYTKAKHRAAGQSKWQVYWQRFLLILKLRRKHYDLAILAGSRFSRHALKLAISVNATAIMGVIQADKPSVKIHYALPELYDDRIHEAQHCLRLLTLLGIQVDNKAPAMLYAKPELQQQQYDKLLQQTLYKQKDSDCLTIGIHISARKQSQRWPESAFIALMQRLQQNYNCQFLLFWAPGDESNTQHPGDNQKAQRILDALSASDVAVFPIETQQLRELIAGISLCDQFICSDGGAMHIAAGLAKPLVCFFGKSNPQQWHPWQVTHQLLQAESQQVSDISSAEAFTAFQHLYSRLETNP
jgi:ADP-heptose:LPS heptosyltransferase